MGPCPYCGERVGAEARICRFCNRSLLYSAVVSASLDEKQKHEFLRLWQAIEPKTYKHLPLSNYTIARKELDKIPLTIAWDLNLFSADVLEKKFAHLGIEKRLQGGLPSSQHPAPSQMHPVHSLLNLMYFGVGISLLVVAIYAWLHMREARPPEPQAALTPPSEIITFKPSEIAPAEPAPRRAPADPFMEERSMNRSDIERLLAATVFLRGDGVVGSGFVISTDGYILSNSHVTSKMSEPTVIFNDGRSFRARKIREDARYDISLIKIDGGTFSSLDLGDANEVFAGEPVITIGNPGGLSFTITRGIVSYNGRIIENTPYIQTDAAINPGNSGGPMINSSLQVVGINTLTSTSGQGISFSLPINLACDLNGIAQSVVPRTCPSYESNRDTAMNTPMSTGSAPDPYQMESEETHRTYLAEKNQLQSEFENLKAETQKLNDELAKDPHNNSLRDRLSEQHKGISAQAQKIEIQMREADLRYVNKMIAILERQMLDSRYSRYRDHISSQLEKARQDQKRILDLLVSR